MRYSYTTWLTMAFTILLTSCHTSTAVIVKTEPGSEVLTPNLTPLGIADSEGYLELKIDDNNYFPFLLSHKPNESNYIPFALNYKHKSRKGAKFSGGLGIGMAGVGLGGMFGALIPMIVAAADGDDDLLLGSAFGVAGGGVLAGLGCAIGAPATERLKQTSYQYEYKYLPYQNTNNDLPLTKPQFNVASRPETSVPAIAVTEPSTQVSRKIGQVANRTLKDYGKAIQGEYIGNGTLTIDNQLVESYDNIKIVVRRVSKDVAAVKVVESNGNEYFSSESRYKIEAKNDGTFDLIMEDINTATISIDRNQGMIYLHPRVNIDGKMYILRIEGRKKVK